MATKGAKSKSKVRDLPRKSVDAKKAGKVTGGGVRLQRAGLRRGHPESK